MRERENCQEQFCMAINSLLAKQVSGHDFSHAVKGERSVAFRPCVSQGLKPASIGSLSDTCRVVSYVSRILERRAQ